MQLGPELWAPFLWFLAFLPFFSSNLSFFLLLPLVPVFSLQGYQEQGILFGYRPPSSSAADCLLSVFQMTNETLNIWTHFVPAW